MESTAGQQTFQRTLQEGCEYVGIDFNAEDRRRKLSHGFRFVGLLGQKLKFVVGGQIELAIFMQAMRVS